MSINDLSNLFTWPLLPVLAYSILCGSIIGYERLKKSKSIDMRASVFVCLGAAIFAFLGSNISGPNTDHSRVVSTIVTGIGFIGGGVIYKSFSTERVVGLTTASLLWILASVGVTIGLGYGPDALLITIIVYVYNVLTLKFEDYSYQKRRMNRKKKYIRFKDHNYQELISGMKKATVRRGVKGIVVGDHYAVNAKHPEQKRIITVKKVVKKKYKEIDEAIAKAENYESLEKFKEHFKTFYPKIQDNDEVTIIYFKLKGE